MVTHPRFIFHLSPSSSTDSVGDDLQIIWRDGKIWHTDVELLEGGFYQWCLDYLGGRTVTQYPTDLMEHRSDGTLSVYYRYTIQMEYDWDGVEHVTHHRIISRGDLECALPSLRTAMEEYARR